MEKISKSEFEAGTAYMKHYFENNKNVNDRIAFFRFVDVFISESGYILYIRDTENPSRLKYYKDSSDTLIRIYKSMRELYIREISVRTHKVDMEVFYDDLDKTQFLYGPIEFKFADIRDLFFNIEKARMSYENSVQKG